MLLDVVLNHGSHLLVVANHASFVQVIAYTNTTLRPFLIGPAANLWLEERIARLRVAQVVGQRLRVRHHHLGALAARIQTALGQTVEEGRAAAIGLLGFVFVADPSLGVLCAATVRLESALSIHARTVNVHLSFIPAHCILIETVKLAGTLPAVVAPSASLLQDLRAVAHDFGGLSRDLRLKVELFGLFVGLEGALEVQDLVSALAIVDQQVLSGDVSGALAARVGLRLESQTVHFLAKLLAAGIADAILTVFFLLEASTVELLSIISSRRVFLSRGSSPLRVRPL